MLLRLHKLNLLFPLALIALLWLMLSSCRTSKESIQVTNDSTITVRPREVRLVIPADSLKSELQELDQFGRQLAAAPPDGVVVTGKSGRLSYVLKRAPAGQVLGFVVEVMAAGRDSTLTVTDTTKVVRKAITKTVVAEDKKAGVFGWFNHIRDNVKQLGMVLMCVAGITLLVRLLFWLATLFRRRK